MRTDFSLHSFTIVIIFHLQSFSGLRYNTPMYLHKIKLLHLDKTWFLTSGLVIVIIDTAMWDILCRYCKSTNVGVLLYLANLANCVFSLIFVAPTHVNYVDRTLHRRGDAKFNSRQITLFWETPNFIAAKICWFTLCELIFPCVGSHW